MLPNFIVIGAMKAGTTAIYRYLAAHPQVFMSAQKELRFFAEAHNWHLGLDWYEAQFAGGADALARGEASPAYSAYPLNPEAPKLMASVIPDAKLLYLVRHPIERMQTHWLYLRQRGTSIPREVDDAFFRYPSLIDRSRYATQIEQFMEHFPRDQLLVVVSEKLRDDRERTMSKVFDFLDLDSKILPDVLDREFHVTAKGRGRRPLAQRVRRIPGYAALAKRTPHRVRALNYLVTTRRIDPARSIAKDSTRLVAEQILGPEVTRLRDYIDDPDFDGWGLG